jgi:putative hydrolase of the HAD superfamily
VPSPRLPAGVVFDLDDTLLDTAGVEEEMLSALCDVARPEHPELDDAELRRRWFALRNELYLRVLQGEWDLETYRRTHLRQVLSPWGEPSDPLMETFLRLRDRQVEECRFVEHAVELLAELRAAGVRTSLLTNGPSFVQRRKVELMGLEEHLDGIAISEEIGLAKPDPAAFAAALALIDCAPREAIMVGDNVEWDVHGALGAGMLGAVWIALDDEAGDPPPGAVRVRRLRDVLAALAEVVSAAS